MKSASWSPVVNVILVAVIAVLMAWIARLEREIEVARARLEDPPPACSAVAVTCVCPDYEDGWEDSEHAEGCDPEPISIEDLRAMCEELEAYGYVAGC